MMRPSLIAAVALALTACAQDDVPVALSDETDNRPGADWETLFAGEDLNAFDEVGDGNWRIIDDYVESGDGDHGFLVTKGIYRDFELHVEFWPSTDANSGVFMRCQDQAEIANETCYELNIMDEHPKRHNATGSIINLAAPREDIKTAGKWNNFDITVRGSRIIVRLNDSVVVDFRDQSFDEGPIGLQGKSGTIRFRNVKVKPLATEEEIWAQTVAAAEKEGSVVCACPPVRSLGEFLDAEWSSTFPNIALERISAVGDWPARITVEREAGVYLWDTYFWASNPPVYELKNKGAFVPLVPELIREEVSNEAVWGGWEQAFMDEDKRYLLSFRVELSKIAFNADHISAAELGSVEDLMKPRYKGMISIEDPRVTGAGDVFGAWFVKEYGADAWQSLLVDQDVLFAASKDEQAQGLARGPHYIAIPNPGAAGLRPYRDAGVNMDIQYLGHDSDNAFVTIAYSVTGIFDPAPHPNAARVFANWLLSKDIQEKLKRFDHNSRRRDVTPADPDKYPSAGVDYFYPQSEAAVDARQAAIALAKEARPN